MAKHLLIGHLDADCFYVSAERVRHSYLRHQPVGVLGNQGACIIAKSYEAKARGITTGMPIWEALPRCPEAIFVKRDFRWYEVLSKRMLDVLREVSPSVEYYSIDEMFFDAGELSSAFRLPLPEATAALQQRLLQEVGVPVSIGISPSKCLSKLASDARKPFGCTLLLEADQVDRFLAGLDVGELWGIGGKSVAKLKAHGIDTCLDFAKTDRQTILRMLTVKGEGIWWELRGESVIGLQTSRPAHQRISRGGSLGGAVGDPARLQAWAIRNLERLIEELDFHQVTTRRLVMTLAYKAGSGAARRVTLPQPTAAFDLLEVYVSALLRGTWDQTSEVSYMHLDAELLESCGRRQLTMFGEQSPAAERVGAVKRQINQKLGRFALRSAATLVLEDVYADESNDYDICDVHGKICF